MYLKMISNALCPTKKHYGYDKIPWRLVHTKERLVLSGAENYSREGLMLSINGLQYPIQQFFPRYDFTWRDSFARMMNIGKHSVSYRYQAFIYNNSDCHYEPNSCSRYCFVEPICRSQYWCRIFPLVLVNALTFHAYSGGCPFSISSDIRC